MIITKYYLKIRCKYCYKVDNGRYTKKFGTPIIKCMRCNNTNFTRGADVTELVERLRNCGIQDCYEDLIEVVKNEH